MKVEGRLFVRLEEVGVGLEVLVGHRRSDHLGVVLEDLIGQTEGAFLVDVVCRGTLADVHVPKTQHLVALDFNLRLAVRGRDGRAILGHLVFVVIVAHLGAVEILGVRWRLARAHRLRSLLLAWRCLLRTDGDAAGALPTDEGQVLGALGTATASLLVRTAAVLVEQDFATGGARRVLDWLGWQAHDVLSRDCSLEELLGLRILRVLVLQHEQLLVLHALNLRLLLALLD